MNENTQKAIAAMKSQLAAEIEYLVDDEGYIDDVNSEVDMEDLDDEDSFLASEADTVIFFNELITKLEGGWVPADFDECNDTAMGFYMATVGGAGYGDSDSTDSICEDLMKAFDIEYDEDDVIMSDDCA